MEFIKYLNDDKCRYIGLVLNTDKCEGPGIHWLVVFMDKKFKKSEVFDSTGANANSIIL